MEIPLIAARFAPLAGSFVLDLATGERAYLAIEAVGEDDGTAWAERCAALCGLWHPSLAECLDFGLLGAGHRFIAHRASRLASSREAAAAARYRRAEIDTFLQMCGVETRATAVAVADPSDRVFLLPAVDGIREPVRTPARSEGFGTPTGFGIRLVGRPVLRTLVEHLTLEAPPGVSVVVVDASIGSGGRTLLRALAREARRHGFVPVSSVMLEWIAGQAEPAIDGWSATLARHHLVVLHDGRVRPFSLANAAWGPLLRIGARHPRTRLVVELSSQGGATSGFRLTPLTADELVAMIVLPAAAPRLRARIERAARAARGRPGRFVQSVARLLSRLPGNAAKHVGYTVHEQPAPYGEGQGPLKRSVALHPASSSRPATSLLLTAEIPRALSLASRGRHAAADRLLARICAMAARRECWDDAANVALARAQLRASRGRVDQALPLLLEALQSADRAHAPSRAIVVLTWLGLLRLEDARVEEAESTLRSAAAGACRIGDGLLGVWSAGALADCLWWQGRYEEAQCVLANSGPVPDAAPPDDEGSVPGWPGTQETAFLRSCVSAQIAISLGDPVGARRELDAATRLDVKDQHLRVRLRCVEARWHAVVGRAGEFRAALLEAMQLAKAARRPLDRLRAMVELLEGAWRLGDTSDCSSSVRRLESASRRRLPGLLAFRIRLATGRVRGTLDPRRAAEECAARRLDAIAPAVAMDHPLACSPRTRSVMFDHVIEVLEACQEEEPPRALERVLEIVIRRTRAAAVEFLAPDGLVSLGHPRGVRLPSIGTRVIEVGVPIEPTLTDRGMEAGVPLRFGGQVIGALTCRWPGGPPLEMPALMGLLA
ncbi:MAG TPA: tetratricopeptide repeat protein, partial [Vicinamibacterales bacterium]|nr:tetratricopeptide repeat protein [Vicinamibacterales bacterium]